MPLKLLKGSRRLYLWGTGTVVLAAVVGVFYWNEPAQNSIGKQDSLKGIPKLAPPLKVLPQITKQIDAQDISRDSKLTQTSTNLSPEQKELKVAQLLKYATSYDPTTLPLIEPSLYSTDSEVRGAALNAVVILGAQEGGVILRKAAAASKDPNEASELLAKADYLELPSLTALHLKIISEKPVNPHLGDHTSNQIR